RTGAAINSSARFVTTISPTSTPIPRRHAVAKAPSYAALTLFQARFTGIWILPEACAARRTDTAISANAFRPAQRPQTLVFEYNLLWLNVPSDDYRR
ncbi:MAG: hypothetical protein H7145_23135, partial [Akkermansiaceae bacterium]|nr:hypothetical protein [Armatimonadota bacterium]